jgi:hypothetical protein
LLAPVHQAARGKGTTADEIDALDDRAREEYWAYRRAQQQPAKR